MRFDRDEHVLVSANALENLYDYLGDLYDEDGPDAEGKLDAIKQAMEIMGFPFPSPDGIDEVELSKGQHTVNVDPKGRIVLKLWNEDGESLSEAEVVPTAVLMETGSRGQGNEFLLVSDYNRGTGECRKFAESYSPESALDLADPDVTRRYNPRFDKRDVLDAIGDALHRVGPIALSSEEYREIAAEVQVELLHSGKLRRSRQDFRDTWHEVADQHVVEALGKRGIDVPPLEYEREYVPDTKVEIDPRGNAILAYWEREDGSIDALLMRSHAGDYQPYVVASGYDAMTGTWSQGEYYDDLAMALDDADPDIIQSATTRWSVEDIRYPLSVELDARGVDADSLDPRDLDRLVSDVLDKTFRDKYFMDAFIVDLNDTIYSEAATVAEDYCEGIDAPAQRADAAKRIAASQGDSAGATRSIHHQ